MREQEGALDLMGMPSSFLIREGAADTMLPFQLWRTQDHALHDNPS